MVPQYWKHKLSHNKQYGGHGSEGYLTENDPLEMNLMKKY